MTLDDIFNEWNTDSKIDPENLNVESLSTPLLHSKYWKILIKERLTLKKLKYQFDTLKSEKKLFYIDGPTPEQLKAGWEYPAKGRIMKPEVDIWMNKDKEIIEMAMKVDLQNEKVELLQSIIDVLNRRGFHIKAAIDWIKFKNGIS